MTDFLEAGKISSFQVFDLSEWNASHSLQPDFSPAKHSDFLSLDNPKENFA